jgi:SAM-dependent methyltransferase
MSDIKNVFTNIYLKNLWEMGQTNSKSGLGSSDIFTENIKKIIPDVIEKYEIKTMIDTSCGDWNWMKKIQESLNCNYIGIDVVDEIIEENKKKFSSEKFEFISDDFLSYLKNCDDNSVDLILCRHTCEHLEREYIQDFLKEVKRVSKYLLLTTHKLADTNKELIKTETPYRPINLNLPPYSNILDIYQIDSFYDGPESPIIPEMYINLYYFSS